MNLEHITQIVAVGQVAMDLWRAQEAVANAEHAYHMSISEYEQKHGHLDKLIQKSEPTHAAVREYTAPKYKLLQHAKRRVYILRCRLRGASAKMARMSAERAA